MVSEERGERRLRRRARRFRERVDTSRRRLLWLRLLLYVALPAVVAALAVVIVVDLLGVGGPRLARSLVVVEYLVLGYFVLELGLDFVLYDSPHRFLTDRWVDLLLVVPLVLLVEAGAWLGGLALVGRALLTVEFVEAVGFEAFALRELTASGTRLQRALKLIRRGRRLLWPGAPVD